jgi:hypothetical protein
MLPASTHVMRTTTTLIAAPDQGRIVVPLPIFAPNYFFGGDGGHDDGHLANWMIPKQDGTAGNGGAMDLVSVIAPC